MRNGLGELPAEQNPPRLRGKRSLPLGPQPPLAPSAVRLAAQCRQVRQPLASPAASRALRTAHLAGPGA